MVELGSRRGARARTSSPISPAAGRSAASAGMPIAATRSSPVCALPGAIQWPSLAAWKLTVTSRLHGDALDLAGGGVDAGGDVGRDDRRPAAVDRLDRGVGRGPRCALRSRCRRSRRRRRPSRRARRRSRRAPTSRDPALEALEVGRGVGRELGGRPQQQRLDLVPGRRRAGGPRPARRRRCCPSRRRPGPAPVPRHLARGLGDRRPRGLHQLERRASPAPRSPTSRRRASRRRRRAGDSQASMRGGCQKPSQPQVSGAGGEATHDRRRRSRASA